MSRTNDAYDADSRARYRAWKASLTWPEYLAWKWSRWRSFVAGGATGAVVALLWLASR